jgi:hypothetical protein
MDEPDLPPRSPRLTYAELETLALDLADRVLMLEAGLNAPLSIIDHDIAKALDEKRRAAERAVARRVEMFNKANAEAARTRSRKPIDAFVRSLSPIKYWDGEVRQRSSAQPSRRAAQRLAE